ncbi:ankyrin repeat-containing domain protein [Mycena sanguinolenta]|nr:ankyrin repeat-containing domain protein [Mycena sanguinolenta]
MTPSHPGPESTARKTVDNATNVLDTAVSFLGTLSDFTANVPYLNAITGVVKHLIEIHEAAKSNKERADVLFKKIGTITRTIAAGLLELNDALRSAAADALQGDLEKYNSILVDAAHILKEWTSQSIVQRVFKHGDFDGIANNLEKRIESFHNAFGVARLTALSKGQHETNAMLTTLIDSDTRTKLEKWLKPAGLAASDQNASNKKHPGTGKWLLENSFEFSEWIYAPMAFLWLHGISGSGKTVLRIGQLGVYAFFYFDINHPQQQTANNLLCSLVYQLSGQLLCPALSRLWETCQNGGRLPSNSDLLSILKQFGGSREIYLLVDALDECSECDILLGTLSSILEAKLPQIHLIVTSQTEVTHCSLAKEAVLVSLGDSMGGYITKNKDDISKELLDTGGNMFRLVALQLEALQKSGGTKSKVTKALATMPTTLAGIYDRILETTDMCDQVCRAMNWLIFGLREMKLKEIIDALAFDFSEDKLKFDEDERMDPQALLNACGSLVSVPQNWDDISVVRLSHASVKDYFLESGSTKCGVQVSEQSAQCLIAKTCLAYFNSLDPNVLPAKKDYSLVDYASCLHSTSEQDYPLVKYASYYWNDHLNRYKNFVGDQSMCDLFQELLQENNPKYIVLRELLEYYVVTSGFELGPPLGLVAYMGIQQGIPLVLKQDTNINVQYSTALQAAAHGGNIELVQLFLAHNADPNFICGEYGTALQAAAYMQNIGIVQLLLEHNADPNIMAGEYGTALQAAAYGKNVEIVQLLLEHGANVTIQGGCFGTPLQAAAAWGSIDIVKLLLEHHVDLNIVGGQYGTALQAATYKENIGIVQLLLEHNADPNIMAGEYDTVLQTAAYRGNTEIVRLFLEHNADPNIVGGECDTALQAAAYIDKIEIVQLLLKHNADPNIMGGEYGTALQAAAYGDSIDIVHLLLEHHADHNIVAGKYGTALQAAAHEGNIAIVKLLLEHGANVNIQGGEYRNAIQAATAEGYLEIVQLLKAHGAM